MVATGIETSDINCLFNMFYAVGIQAPIPQSLSKTKGHIDKWGALARIHVLG